MTITDSPGARGSTPVTEHDTGTLLYESARTRVARLRVIDPDGAARNVIWKEFLGVEAAERMRREIAVLTRLSGVAGIGQLAQTSRSSSGFALADVEGVSLAAREDSSSGFGRRVEAGPDLVNLVGFALTLAKVLAVVHRAGVVHKDINPANILIGGPDHEPVLIDWDLATTFAQEQPGFTHESTIAGTLAYLAPEQTGRTGQSVDQRADLYAVGATLYELATGGPPFGDGDGDALALIHDHLARVPTAPSGLNAVVPPILSDIILRLLEKEPDRRYQSAEGLAYDLARVLDSLTGNDPAGNGSGARFPLAERDFPTRICAPSRLVGREAEILALRTALDSAVAGRGRGLLVTGESGVGKSALIDQLRSMVTEKGGWFVQGKFDQYRQDESTDAVAQAMRALVRMLLAEPEDQLAALRPWLREAVGADAELMAAVMPEFSVLLGVAAAQLAGDPRQPVDPKQLQARLLHAGLGVLRALASPERPIVMVIDDLQWAGAFPISFLEAVLLDDSLPGLLLVGAYRDNELDDAHPFSAVLSRWERLGATPTSLRLTNLPPTQLGTLLAEMLRLAPERAADLAAAVNGRTGGNPYDTVELVNSLRREGALTLEETGWQWEATKIRRFVGHGDVVALLSTRIETLPADAAGLLEVLACLGGDVPVDMLVVAADLSPRTLEEFLAPSLEDGLIVMIHDGPGALRFRHDRVQQAAYARLDPLRRGRLHLRLARNLAAHPHLEAAAAEQYLLSAQDAIEGAERRQVAELFRAAAAHARLINQAAGERFLVAALALLQTPDTTADVTPDATADDVGSVHQLVTHLLIDRQAALFNLGRLGDAGELYGQIERRSPSTLELADAAAVQIVALTHTGRAAEAMTLGLVLLTRLGFPPPAAEALPEEIERGLGVLYRWVADGPQPGEVDRAEASDPRIMAASRMLEQMVPAAFYSRHPVLPWMMIQAHSLWVEHGPNAPLAVSLTGTCMVGIMLRQDYAIGYEIVRRILKVSAGHGFEPATSQVRIALASFGRPWFEPLERVITQVLTAREGLLRCGQLQYTSFTYLQALTAGFECAPVLDASVAEIDVAMTFFARTGDDIMSTSLRSFQPLLRCLRDETDPPGSFADGRFDETAYLVETRDSPVASYYFHRFKATAAAIFMDSEGLAKHTEAAMSLLGSAPGFYVSAIVHLLRGLALAQLAKAAGSPMERDDCLAEFDRCRGWLADRAVHAPENFGHLVRWLDAERAWALEDFETAIGAFDAAMSEVGRRSRPWHAALITERAARFHLAQGLVRIGHTLITEARDQYERWGAKAKVTALNQEFPSLATPHPLAPLGGEAGVPSQRGPSQSLGSSHTIVVSSEAIDLMSLLRACQALSSETNLDRLRIRMVEVLTAMTGATSVRLLLWNEDAQGWFLPGSDGGNDTDDAAAVRLEEAGAAGMICLSAFRYAERTREPLLVPDASRDDRFARDPYLKGLESCSLLVVPIVSRGIPRAMLVMENRLSQGIFTSQRLDAVVLIAGQLTVSLDNALAERFRSLVQRSSELTLVSDRAGLLSYASAASTELLGVESALLTGRPMADLVHPDDREIFTAWIGDGGPAGQMLECRVLPVAGTPRWVQVNCTDLSNDPAVAGVVLHLRDVSERRHLENELRHAQKLESVGQLAAGVAHEINTPIQFIADNLRFIHESLAPVDALLEDYRQTLASVTGPPDLVAQRQALSRQEQEIDLEFLRQEVPPAARQALDGTDQVARIVRAMKAFAHPGGEEKNYADLNEAIRNTLIVANSEIMLIADVVLDLGELPAVWCNLGDINQAVLNLVVNAAHAIGEAAAAGRGRGTLTVRTRSMDGTIVVEIEDSGNGIPAEIGDRVFEQFFTTKAVGVGTGQGLALAYAMIHGRHDGTLTFTSTPNVGTTFTIRLPQQPPKEPE
jgi:PAS domain S-box-containing protein